MPPPTKRTQHGDARLRELGDERRAFAGRSCRRWSPGRSSIRRGSVPWLDPSTERRSRRRPRSARRAARSAAAKPPSMEVSGRSAPSTNCSDPAAVGRRVARWPRTTRILRTTRSPGTGQREYCPDRAPADAARSRSPLPSRGGRGRLAKVLDEPEVTVVFAHGFCLNLDCWHFQRAAYRGLVRTVYYDQRSHGRSGRSTASTRPSTSSASDLSTVLDAVAPEGRVVLVGHSMGGMTIVALAEQYPELFGDRVVGAAPDLHHRRRARPEPDPAADAARPAHRAAHRTARSARCAAGTARSTALRRAGRGDRDGRDRPVRVRRRGAGGVRRRSSTRCCPPRRSRWSPSSSRASAPRQVRRRRGAGAGPDLGHLRHRGQAHLDRPQRKLHERIAGSRLLECDDAGHMVILERHDQVNAELDQLITAAVESAAHRVTPSGDRRVRASVRSPPRSVLAVVRAAFGARPSARPARRRSRRDRGDRSRAARAARRAARLHRRARTVGALVLDPVGRRRCTCAASGSTPTPRATASPRRWSTPRSRPPRAPTTSRWSPARSCPTRSGSGERQGFRETPRRLAERRARAARCRRRFDAPDAEAMRDSGPALAAALRAGDLVVLERRARGRQDHVHPGARGRASACAAPSPRRRS